MGETDVNDFGHHHVLAGRRVVRPVPTVGRGATTDHRQLSANARRPPVLLPPTPLEVQQWIAALQARGLQPSSIAYKLSVVRTLAKWAIDAGLLDRDPTRGMKHRVPKKAPRVPTQDEVKALLRACGRMRWTPGCA